MLREIAKRIRHAPGLAGQEWLWDLARAPYHKMLGLAQNGVRVSVAGDIEVRIPPEFSGTSWEEYEPESVRAVRHDTVVDMR